MQWTVDVLAREIRASVPLIATAQPGQRMSAPLTISCEKSEHLCIRFVRLKRPSQDDAELHRIIDNMTQEINASIPVFEEVYFPFLRGYVFRFARVVLEESRLGKVCFKFLKRCVSCYPTCIGPIFEEACFLFLKCCASHLSRGIFPPSSCCFFRFPM